MEREIGKKMVLSGVVGKGMLGGCRRVAGAIKVLESHRFLLLLKCSPKLLKLRRN